MRTAFVLSGGGARGDFQLGALAYLEDAGIRPDIISATSVGSLNGLMLAHGPGALQRLKNIWFGLRRNPDMYAEEPWLSRIHPSLRDLILHGVQGSGELPDLLGTAGVGAGVGFVLLGPIGALVGTASGALVAGKINQVAADEVKKLVNIVLTEARGLYNLGPIGTLIDANLRPSQIRDWAAGVDRPSDFIGQRNRQLRLAAVGLETGEIGYVNELGDLFDFDQTRVKARDIPLKEAALASASIAGVFTPIAFKNEWWVDGGHREILPIRAAIQLGATEVWAISCSPIDRYSAVNRIPGGKLPDFTNKTLLEIVQRALVEIHLDEINADDLLPHGGWGVPVRVIMPRFPVHDMLTIHPALIRISYAYGYMCAADVHRQVPPRVESLAWEITAKRLEILLLENYIVPNLDLLHLDESDEDVANLRQLKLELRELIRQRLVFGGIIPPEGYAWYSWEEHPGDTGESLNQRRKLFENEVIGIGDHFYTISATERDNALIAFGYRSEGIACYVFESSATMPLYRLLSGATGDHFYTTDLVERDNAINAFGYQSEGVAVACFVHSSQVSGSTPLYRLLHQTNGDHFYTISPNERDSAINTFGYQPEGVACYVFSSQGPGSTPLYRLLNPATGDHFYTISVTERDNAIAQYGYSSEGVACYVFESSATMPLYRLLSGVTGDHFYTTDLVERDNALANYSYRPEGVAVACFVHTSQVPGSTPLYRLLHPTNGDHFYTIFPTERDNAVNALGHQSEIS